MSQSIRLLLIEDDEEDYMITRDILDDIPSKKYQLDWVDNFEEGVVAVAKEEHDAYLLDYRLGREDGLALLKEVKAIDRDTPFILLTGQDDLELDREAMAAGAADFLVKGNITPSLLERTIRYAIQKKKVEKKLELEKRTAQMYLDIAGSMIIVIDVEERIQLLNQRGEELLGVKEEEVIGQNWFDNFVPTEVREEVRHVFDRLMENKEKEVEYYENPIQAKNGQQKIIWWHNRVLFKNGKPIGTISSGVDITAERTREQQLIQSESNATTLFEYSPIMVWEEDFTVVKQTLDKLKMAGVTDFRTYYQEHQEDLSELASQIIIKKVNKKTLDYYKVSSLEELEQNISNWFIEDSFPIFMEEIIALAEGKTSFESEIPIVTQEGTVKYLHFHLIVPPTYQDTLEKVIISFIDITAQKKAVKYLAESNQALEEKVKYRTAELESSQLKLNEAQAVAQIGHWEWDVQKEQVIFSRGMYHIFDLEEDRVVKPGEMAAYFHPDDQQLIQDKIAEAHKRKQGYSIEHRIITPKNNLKYVHSQVKTIQVDDEGELLHIFGVLRDITQEKEAAIQLETALQKERDLGELKSRFVSMASHEFRTPLSSILSSAELLGMYLELGKHDKCEKNINRIKSSVRNLTGILNDFLSLEKLEAGKVSIQKTTFTLKEYLEELQDEMKPILKKNQQLNVSHPNLQEIHTDAHLLTNILINLLSNAIKYSPKGEDVELAISVEKDHWLVKVIDHGIGIPEEDKAHMFSRFFRASNVENIKGTGLGLTIVKRYLSLLGGTIGFESEYGKGSTFYFTLPK